jgi:hemerythrin-like domain-containing protein
MELMQLEEVMAPEIINYPALLHGFKTLCVIWDKHEKSEESLFSIMKGAGILFPVQMMTSTHEELRGHITEIQKSILSGSDYRIRRSFKNDLKIIIDIIRDHINKEDEVLYTTTLTEIPKDKLEKLQKIISA